MPLQATSGAASYDAFGGGVAAVPNYIEDVFSTWLTTGAGANITVVNGIDLAGKGGMVWNKTRNSDGFNTLFDTSRGVNKALFSNDTSAETTISNWLPAFNSDGFVIGTTNNLAASGNTGVSWTFRKQPKFFDVVTFTTPSSGVITINHNLGSVPGCVILKRTDASQIWVVNHRSLDNTEYLILNDAAGEASASPLAVTYGATTVTYSAGYLTANAQYVAYIFAHDAGGFGLTGTDNVISCGSFTTNGSSAATVTLGYEPQWILTKRTDGAGAWGIYDTMRGWSFSAQNYLLPNDSGAEGTINGANFVPTATGFNISAPYDASATYIYIAIRRGPMKVPTTGTSVFTPLAYTGNSGTQTVTTGFPVDAMIEFERTNSSGVPSAGDKYMTDRLRGSSAYLETSSTNSESTGFVFGLANNTGVTLSTYFNTSPRTYIIEAFRRAPGFFDEVCYTGTASTPQTVTHNLGVAPELIFVKNRSTIQNWRCLYSSTGGVGVLNSDTFFATSSTQYFFGNNTAYVAPTASSFTVGDAAGTNESGSGMVAYLFATCAGVSKVGSYTGTGTTQTINCGFTGGARFVLIKRTDDTGDWYVWDSARGIVAGDDPYLLLNSTAAEVTNTDYVDTAATGFEITSTAPAAINASGGAFVFLAIA
jgi:hypothetical protein